MFCFVCIHRVQRGERERGSNTLTCYVACFVHFHCLISLFPCFPSPPALCWYLPLLPDVSSVQQVAVSLHQHVGCFSCSRYGFLASHSSEPLVFSFLVSNLFLCYDVARFVVLSCPVRRHFTCFMLINHCDRLVYPVSHILCMSLRINNKHGRRVYSTHITINLLVTLPAVLQFFL